MSTHPKQTVAILGASPKPDRYANKAMHKLEEHGHSVILINPGQDTIEGHEVLKSLADIADPIDTLTLYLGPQRLKEHIHDILHLRPNRVIFNPGTELPGLMNELKKADIPYLEACTLVLLSTGQF